MISDSGPWSLGTLIAFPIAVLVCIGLVVALVFAFRWHKTERYDKEFPKLVIGVSMVALLVNIGFTAFGMYPYSSEYHQWRHVSGTVDSVHSRFISSTSGESTEQRFLLTIDGQPFGVDDTRASGVKPGDHVDLVCKKEWQYAANSGWGCRWSD